MKCKKLLRSCLAFHVYMCRFSPTPASDAQARLFRKAPIRTFQSNRLSQVIFGASDVWSLSNLAQFGSPRWKPKLTDLRMATADAPWGHFDNLMAALHGITGELT